MDSPSYYSWVTLRCNKASLLSQTHPDLAIKEYQETLKLFKYFPHQRLEETCRINLNNLDVPQPELDHRLFNSECPICMEPLGESKFILKCRHAYHRNCLSPCRDCPLCRSWRSCCFLWTKNRSGQLSTGGKTSGQDDEVLKLKKPN